MIGLVLDGCSRGEYIMSGDLHNSLAHDKGGGEVDLGLGNDVEEDVCFCANR